MDKKELKIAVLKEILARKSVLFGAFSPKLTKEHKNNAWKDVHKVALAYGVVPAAKDYTYTRDVFWQNIKKSSLKKRDNSRQTGSGGGTKAKINEIDILVFEIVGNDSAVLDGLQVTETPPPCGTLSTHHTTQAGPSEEPGPNAMLSVASRQPSLSGIQPLSNAVKKTIQKKKDTTTVTEELRRKKVELTIKYLELKILKLQQEIGGIPHCEEQTVEVAVEDDSATEHSSMYAEYLDENL